MARSIVRLRNTNISLGVIVALPLLLIATQRAHAQDCEVYCDGGLSGVCPGGGVGCPETPEECLDMCTALAVSCGCRSHTDCVFDGTSIMPPPVCGNGFREGTEECDPGAADPESDCDCPGQCQADCTCPAPPGDCEVWCDGGLSGVCPGGGVGCPETPEECLDMCTALAVSCGCRSHTDCVFDGTSIMPPPVCGNGFREGTEECDPGAADPESDCDCPGQCQTNCTCLGPSGVCGNNVREGTEHCDGTDDTACPGLCQTDCTCVAEPIPAVSEWGMVLLMLSLLVGIKLRFDRYPTTEPK